MMRTPLTLAFGAVLAVLVPASASAEPVVTLRSAARITTAQVTLGDLFDNAGDHAGDVVAAAPALGTSLLFESTWLTATARGHGLTWQPPSAEAAIRVQRAARTLDNAELIDRLATQLGVTSAKTKLVFDAQYRLDVPLGDQPGYGIDHAEINPATKRFTAELRIPADDRSAAPIRIAGRLVTMVDLPVLARPMAPGEQLTAADVVWSQVASTALSAGDITDPQEMIGRTPRHPLQAGQPLRPVDLQVPIVIKRNDAVLIVLERPGLYMTAEGKALDEGGRGALIRVVNVQSNRTIDAVVLGSGQVAVRPPAVQQALAR
jgi:flagella basal body P-ring formation protein FlgA